MSNVNLNTYINEYVKNTIPLSPIPLVSIPTVQNKCITYEVMSKTLQTEYYGDQIIYKIKAIACIYCNQHIIKYVTEQIHNINKNYYFTYLDVHMVDEDDDITFIVVKWNAKDKLDIENIQSIIINTIEDINKEINNFNNSTDYTDYKRQSDNLINIVKNMNESK